MILAKESQLDEYIIKALDKGPSKGPALIKQLVVAGKKATKQAVYTSLRNLVAQEVITKTGNVYELNRVWLQKLNTFTKRHLSSESSVGNTVLSFEEGDRVTYTFKNPNLMDITWGHLYDLVYEITDPYQVIVNHHPHEWLIYGRPETERYWLNRYNDDKKILLFDIGGKTELDKIFKKEFQSDYIKINNGLSYELKPNQYLAVVGDYIFDILIEYGFEEKVDEIFNRYREGGLDDTEKQLQKLANARYTSKLTLLKNSKKAKEWRKKFAHDFYIPALYHL